MKTVRNNSDFPSIDNDVTFVRYVFIVHIETVKNAVVVHYIDFK